MTLPSTGTFASDPDHVRLHDDGWARLSSGTEAAILWDAEQQLFARLGWKGADAWAKTHGYRLPTVAELRLLHEVTPHVEPYPLPTREMCAAASVPYDWRSPLYRAFHTGAMRSHAWCAEHDAEVLRRAEAAGASAVAVNSKHQTAAEREIYGAFRADGRPIQPPYAGHYDGWTSYMLTTVVVRDAEAPPVDGDTDPAPPPGGHPEPASWRRALRRGMAGEDVAAWQAQLRADGYAVAIDGQFGPATERATRAWQRERELDADGLVGPITRAAIGTPPVSYPDPYDDEPGPIIADLGDLEWLSRIKMIPAKHFALGPRDMVDWIILHSTENPPVDDQGTPDPYDDVTRPWVALGVARWFAGVDWAGRPVPAPRASSHYVIGGDPEPTSGVYQCVKEIDIAWTAGRRVANARAVQLEIVGQAMKTDWSSAVMRPTLERSAAVAARSARRWNIPLREVTTENLRKARQLLEAGALTLPEECRGFISHADVTEVWEVRGGHQDPGGPGDRRWPWDLFLGLVRSSVGLDSVESIEIG